MTASPRFFRGLLMAGLLGSSFWLFPAPVFALDRVAGMDVELSAGYRTDEFDWSIASDFSGTATPNILSELVWEDLEIFQLGLAGDLRLANDRIPFQGLITGYANYGWIFSGDNRDSDYAGDNRTDEFSRSINDAGDGEVWDLSIAAGPEFLFLGGRFGLSPLLGYSYHEQNLILQEGVQAIPPHGPFTGLDSSYDTVWRGGWLGINLRLAPTGSLAMYGRFEWHRAEYLAEANWNLREDLRQPVSFEHTADEADGLVARVGAELAVTDWLRLAVNASYQKWQAEDGVDNVYFADGSLSRVRLNEVNWESLGLGIGLKMLY